MESALVERTAYLMGTRAELATYAALRQDGLATLEQILQVLERTERHLSTWRADSAVSALNRHAVGTSLVLDPQLCTTLAAVYRWHEATGGAFNPAIGRLVEAWDLRGSGRLASSADLARARRTSGLRHFRFSPDSCTIARTADALIDAGGFGKGDALDRVRRELPEVPWLVDLGGQIAVGVPPPGQTGWAVTIAHPARREEAWLQVLVRSGALSTSGGTERDLWVGGQRVGHILDPRDGRPATFRGSVSVWHDSGLVADILSTALHVMGPDTGLEWAEARDLSVCYLSPQASGGVTVAMTTAFRALRPSLASAAGSHP